MNSIFQLKTSTDELESANGGISNLRYTQIAPTRDCTTTNFANGPIHFKFQESGSKWWVPSRSYLRMRLRLTDGAGTTQLALSDGVAPGMNIVSNMLQATEFQINNTTVSRIPDFVSQVDALSNRLTKSKSWLDSVGQSTQWWKPSQEERMNEIASDGSLVDNNYSGTSSESITTAQADLDNAYTAGTTVAYDAGTGVITFAVAGGNTDVCWEVGDYFVFTADAGDGTLNIPAKVSAVAAASTMTVQAAFPADIGAAAIAFSRIRPRVSPNRARSLEYIETIYQPSLSIFNIDHAVPVGDFDLILTPMSESLYQKHAIESVLGVATKVAGTDFKISVVDFYLYVNEVEGPRVENTSFLLDLKDIGCQADKIDSASFGQKNFSVSPSSYGLTVAYQDLRAGENTSISKSKFKAYDTATLASTATELGLDRFFINYAGQNYPAPDADPAVLALYDYSTQMYINTMINTGLYFSEGGCESIQDWHDRGAFYYYSIQKDGSDRSTQVSVRNSFGNSADVDNLRILLFNHSRSVARVEVFNGRVKSVQVEEC